MTNIFRIMRTSSYYSALSGTFLILCTLTFFSTASLASIEPMLPHTYKQQVDVSGWLMSEKLDGVRGYWDGHHLFSKNGNRFNPPVEFIEALPPFPLEGELWAGRQRFEQTVSVVRKQKPHPGWLQIKFAIFDAPTAIGGFNERIARARRWFAGHPSSYAFIIPQYEIEDEEQMLAYLQKIEQIGGEGLIIRQPDGLYTAGRSLDILKVKNYEDAEATVLAQIPGKGRNRGRLGSLLVALENGTEFKIGSGFNDLERIDPPPVGSVITFKYYDKYQSGIPKFPSFMRIRSDRGL